MGNEIQNLLSKISQSPKENPRILGEKKSWDRSSRNNTWSNESNPALRSDPHRLVFESLTNPILHISRIRQLPLEKRLSAYGNLFKMFGHRLETEGFKTGFPSEDWKAELKSLEKVRVAFREDFPEEEFPI